VTSTHVRIAAATLLLSTLSAHVVISPRGATAQQPPASAPRVTIWDGVYTAEQAARGERTAYQNCFSCHTSADWTGSKFLDSSSDQRLGDLFQMISRQMPMDAPGKLSAAQYADVIAYMLRLQGAPDGETELPAELRELDRIHVARPKPKFRPLTERLPL
jgi:mono/diheme cytochrome c family protein